MEVQSAPVSPHTGSTNDSVSTTASGDRGEAQGPDQRDSAPTCVSPARPVSVGLTLCSAALIYSLGYGVVQLIRANYCSGTFLVLGALLAFYYIGRSLKGGEPSSANDVPVVSAGTESLQPADGELLAFKATPVPRAEPGNPVLETLARPTMVVPTTGLLMPPRWLVVRRPDGFQWAYPMPDIPSNHGWYFAWGNFYLRRDIRGHYACAGHPDDRIADEDMRRLFDGATIKMGEYTLTIAVNAPTTLH